MIKPFRPSLIWAPCVLLVAVCLLARVTARAQLEHPAEEHVSGKPVTTADLEKAIRAFIRQKTKASSGEFVLEDNALAEEMAKTAGYEVSVVWHLKLVRIHTDKLTQLDERTYFTCVDFRTADGRTVDVDFYVKNGNGKVTGADTAVHKINGEARFSYQQKDRFWERVKDESANVETADQAKEAEAYEHWVHGVVLARYGELDEAIAEFREAVRLSPDFATAHFALGQALEKKGDLQAALEEYRLAIQLEPDIKDFRKAYEALSRRLTP